MIKQRSAIVALVGRANVGKSTLMNRLLGEKVSIVSPIAQTTRNMVRGILTEERGQLAFLDTPGVHKASYDLGRIMNRAARSSIEGADVVLLLLDASKQPRDEDIGWMHKLCRGEAEVAVALNKTDIGTEFADEYRNGWDNVPGDEPTRTPCWFEVSAKTGEGVDDLLEALFEMAPEGPPLFPEDMLSDFPRRWNISDVVREKFYAHLKDELPHAIAVRVDKLTEKDNRWDVDVLIYVNRSSQKGIVIGHKGQLINKVKAQAEAELTEMYGNRVRLHLWVKVEKNWAKNHWILKQLGYQ